MTLHMVPDGRNIAASLPISAAMRSHSACTVGSSPCCSSPTSARIIASFIAGRRARLRVGIEVDADGRRAGGRAGRGVDHQRDLILCGQRDDEASTPGSGSPTLLAAAPGWHAILDLGTHWVESPSPAGPRPKPPMLTLRQIEVIRAIMVTGTIGGAARLLNVSSPGISRVMKHAESDARPEAVQPAARTLRADPGGHATSSARSTASTTRSKTCSTSSGASSVGADSELQDRLRAEHLQCHGAARHRGRAPASFPTC